MAMTDPPVDPQKLEEWRRHDLLVSRRRREAMWCIGVGLTLSAVTGLLATKLDGAFETPALLFLILAGVGVGWRALSGRTTDEVIVEVRARRAKARP